MTAEDFESLIANARWTNVFQKTSPEMADGLEMDYGKLHAEESVTSAAWLERLTEMFKVPALIEEVAWAPSVEIVMEG